MATFSSDNDILDTMITTSAKSTFKMTGADLDADGNTKPSRRMSQTRRPSTTVVSPKLEATRPEHEKAWPQQPIGMVDDSAMSSPASHQGPSILQRASEQIQARVVAFVPSRINQVYHLYHASVLGLWLKGFDTPLKPSANVLEMADCLVWFHVCLTSLLCIAGMNIVFTTHGHSADMYFLVKVIDLIVLVTISSWQRCRKAYHQELRDQTHQIPRMAERAAVTKDFDSLAASWRLFGLEILESFARSDFFSTDGELALSTITAGFITLGCIVDLKRTLTHMNLRFKYSAMSEVALIDEVDQIPLDKVFFHELHYTIGRLIKQCTRESEEADRTAPVDQDDRSLDTKLGRLSEELEAVISVNKKKTLSLMKREQCATAWNEVLHQEAEEANNREKARSKQDRKAAASLQQDCELARHGWSTAMDYNAAMSITINSQRENNQSLHDQLEVKQREIDEGIVLAKETMLSLDRQRVLLETQASERMASERSIMVHHTSFACLEEKLSHKERMIEEQSAMLAGQNEICGSLIAYIGGLKQEARYSKGNGTYWERWCLHRELQIEQLEEKEVQYMDACNAYSACIRKLEREKYDLGTKVQHVQSTTQNQVKGLTGYYLDVRALRKELGMKTQKIAKLREETENLTTAHYEAVASLNRDHQIQLTTERAQMKLSRGRAIKKIHQELMSTHSEMAELRSRFIRAEFESKNDQESTSHLPAPSCPSTLQPNGELSTESAQKDTKFTAAKETDTQNPSTLVMPQDDVRDLTAGSDEVTGADGWFLVDYSHTETPKSSIVLSAEDLKDSRIEDEPVDI